MIADDLAVLRRQLCERFDLEELRTLCADLGVDFDDLRGEGKTAKAREFVALMQRRGQLGRLKQVVEQRGSILELIDGRYVAFLRRQYGHVPLGGIAPRVQGRALSIPLDELFVPLRAELDAPLQTQFVMSGVRGFQAIHSPDPRLVGLDGITAQPHVVILGEPGAGKSTLLRWMIAQTLRSTGNPKEHSLAVNVLPIFIRLTNFATVLERQPGIGLAQYIRECHLP